MEQRLPRHEKIRFRRGEITDLAAYPSAGGIEESKRGRGIARRALRAVLWAAGISATLVALLVLAVIGLQVSGVGAEKLRSAAEEALEKAAGFDIAASMGPARLALDGSSLLALEIQDVKLARAADGVEIADAGMLRFGIGLLPLLSGNVELSSATLSNARIEAAGLPVSGSTDWTAGLKNEQGLFDPDLVVDLVFASLHKTFAALQNKSTRELSLSDVEFLLPAGGKLHSIKIAEASLAQPEDDLLSIAIKADLDGRLMSVEGTARLNAAAGRISDLQFTAAAAPVDDGQAQPEEAGGHRVGGMALTVTGAETAGRDAPHLDVSLGATGIFLDLGPRGSVAGNVDFRGRLLNGSNKIDVRRLRTTVGRSVLDFYGSIGPRPPTGSDGEERAYRFDMISVNSVLAPESSPEPALNAYVRLTGTYLPDRQKLTADEIAVAGKSGETLGSVSVQFVDGKSPGVAAAFAMHDVPVSHAKQIWPWFSARGARQWVLDKLFGGRVVDGTVSYRVEPGRIGSGIPPTDLEMSGRATFEGTRFDTTGLIPPVRDAVGSVDFRGTSVDVSLTSGTVFLPSGRTVAASNGTMAIRRTNMPPVIADLDMDVAGDAAAVAELASYDPINAMRFVGLSAPDFTGHVSGHVKAEIPLQKGVDPRSLNWLVSLDYKDLSVAKPLDGQMVTEAVGRIVVDPQKAIISAKAKLNGIDAEIDTVEPLRKDGLERKRIIKVVLDDKTRETLVPGLAQLVTGPVKLQLDAKGPGRQQMEADLGDAELKIPWAGWSKGAGIPAKLDFLLVNENGKTTLSGFDLTGLTFAIQGDVTLSGGSLSQAKFSKLQLNRDDDISVSVAREGDGYEVAIEGATLDARALIRQYTADASTATKAADDGSVTVRLDVDTLIGFNDERLSGIKLDYSGSGDKVTGLKVSATTKSGIPVDITNASTAEGRTMRMTSTDAGAILRFLDIYQHMEGGKIDLSLKGVGNGPLRGQVDARDFQLVNEKRLSSIVATPPPGDNQSLSEAVRRDIDTSRVKFDRGYTQIEKGHGYLKLSDGVLRGQQIGATFQGTLYDKAGNMDMTGTFMPAYGLNRMFGEIPIIGMVLGNGRDRGLIGVTFKLEGDADSPRLKINPLSAIAPGIFRSIFEYQ